MTKRKESDLNKAIKKYVELHVNKGLAYVVRNNTIMATVLRSDGSTGFIRNGRKGSPDLILCIRGRFIGVECKIGYNGQSDDQKIAQQEIERAGGVYWMPRSFDGFKEMFDRFLHEDQAVRP